jgi:ADP-ribosylation factor GTPase-activating protein 1
MDAFKAAEIERMRLGGNKTWKEFFEKHPDNVNAGITWDDTTVAERYGGSVGEEWKERLSAKVEGREYVPGEIKKSAPAPVVRATPTQSRSATPSGGPTASPSLASAASVPSGGIGGKAKVDDKYFSKLGAENANRPEDLHPSQGGKYAGFGSEMPAPPVQQGLPGFDDLQKDPVKALTRGWGWLGGVVGKGVQDVNESYIKPTAQKVRFVSCFLPSLHLSSSFPIHFVVWRYAAVVY